MDLLSNRTPCPLVRNAGPALGPRLTRGSFREKRIEGEAYERLFENSERKVSKKVAYYSGCIRSHYFLDREFVRITRNWKGESHVQRSFID